MYLPPCGSSLIMYISGSHTGRPYHPSVPGRTRGTAGVSAAVWEWLDPVPTSFSHRAALSPKRSRQDRRERGTCAAVWERLHHVRT